VAAFNRAASDTEVTIELPADCMLDADLMWSDVVQDQPISQSGRSLTVTVPAHGSVLLVDSSCVPE